MRNTDPDTQLTEVLESLDLAGMCSPFTRCMECSGLIDELDTEKDARLICEKVPPGERSWCDQYFRCISCGRIYWKGSHYDRLRELVDRVLS